MDFSTDVHEDLPPLAPMNPTLQTPPMCQLEQRLTQWLWTGASGAVVTGAARVGKTTALDILVPKVFDRYQRPVPVFRVSIPRRDRPSIVSACRQLCVAVGLRVSDRDTADRLAETYLHYMADTAEQFGVGQLVLVVDECQRLTPDQFDVFAELYDRLRRINRWLLTVFVGNDLETRMLIERMDSDSYAHIRGRFFLNRWTFPGLRSVQDVRDCLAQYDTIRHPLDTDRSLVQGTLPEALSTDFRLATEAGLLWRVFRDQQKRCKLGDWGMQSFSITVNTLLADLLTRYGLEALDEDMVETAIRVSGLIPDQVTVQP